MSQPNQAANVELARLKKQLGHAYSFLVEWKTREVESLPQVTSNVGIHQGRCQVLSELIKLIDKAQD